MRRHVRPHPLAKFGQYALARQISGQGSRWSGVGRRSGQVVRCGCYARSYGQRGRYCCHPHERGPAIDDNEFDDSGIADHDALHEVFQ